MIILILGYGGNKQINWKNSKRNIWIIYLWRSYRNAWRFKNDAEKESVNDVVSDAVKLLITALGYT